MEVIQQNNKLIAEFMGVDYIDIDTYLHDNKRLKYHASWDWLIPVVEKIEGLTDTNGDAYRFSIDMCNSKIEGTNIEIIGSPYKIDSTYKAVLQFIKQLNK